MIQKKRRRRAVLNRVAPTTGRQAFRGMIQPLMLAGGASPTAAQSLGEMYTNSIAVQPTVAPNVDLGKEPCPISELEARYCEFNNTLSFCKKRSLAANDPQCSSLSSAECPLTDLLKKVCDAKPNDPLAHYRDFCKGLKINGECVETAISEMEIINEQARDRKKKEAEERQEEINKKVEASKQCARVELSDAILQVMPGPKIRTFCPIDSVPFARDFIMVAKNNPQMKVTEWSLP